MGADRIGEIGDGARGDSLLECMGQVYSGASGRERSQGWTERDGEQG